MKITGTWIFNETIPWPDYASPGIINHDVGFVKPLAFGIEFNFRYYTSGEYFTFAYYGSNGGTMSSVIAYDSRTGWVSEDMRTVEFTDDADLADECYAWFTANAVRVTTPVQLNPAALMQSFFVGQAVRRMRQKREPVAFLYNGEGPLPKIPEVKLFPFVALCKGVLGSYDLLFSPVPIIYIFNQGIRVLQEAGTVTWLHYSYTPTDPEWRLTGEITASYTDGWYSSPSWANHDILGVNTINTVYLEASEPVPVYE